MLIIGDMGWDLRMRVPRDERENLYRALSVKYYALDTKLFK